MTQIMKLNVSHSYVIETATICYVNKKYNIFPPKHILHKYVLKMIETHETINTIHVGAFLVRVVLSISGLLEVVQQLLADVRQPSIQTIKKQSAIHIGVEDLGG